MGTPQQPPNISGGAWSRLIGKDHTLTDQKQSRSLLKRWSPRV